MSDQDLDRIARGKIRKDIGSNFFVEAGAGSGKTTVLVDRMVSMVEGGLFPVFSNSYLIIAEGAGR